MPLSPVTLAPPRYARQSPRPDMLQAAGTAAAALAAPGLVAKPAYAYAPQAGAGGPAELTIDRDYHAARIEEFEAAEDASRKMRERAERDVDYYDNKQLTEAEFRELERRGQPPVTLNMIRQKVDYLLGLEKTSRTKPRALPRTRRHENDAFAVGDALQYVADDNRYHQLRSRVWKDILTAGWGGLEVVAEEVPLVHEGIPTHRIVFRQCKWDRMWWDAHSAEEDFADANHKGLVRWMDRKDAIREYGEGAEAVFDETVELGMIGGTFDDRPKTTTWIESGRRRRIRVVQEYFRDDDGAWHFCEFTKGGILKAGVSPWRNERGETIHPYEWRSAYVDRENSRYGTIRDLIDPQDEINKRRSKALWHFTQRQTFSTPEARGDAPVNELRRQLARPDGHIALGPGAVWGQNFGIIPTDDQAQGNISLLQQAMQVFEVMGPNAAMMGVKKGDLSGRSVLAQQQGGQIQQGTLTDTLTDLDIGAFTKAWFQIREHWTAETWVRVTDDERNLRWVGLNMPRTQPVLQPVFDPQAPGSMGQQPVIGPDGQPLMEPVIDPQTGMPVLQNNVAEMMVDIIIDPAPDSATILDEQFGLLLQLKQADRNNEIPLIALVQAMPNLRNKADILKALQERQQQPPNPMQVQAAQLEIQNKAANAQRTAAQADHQRALATRIEQEIGHAQDQHEASYAMGTGSFAPLQPPQQPQGF
jgi:hypothetical protein